MLKTLERLERAEDRVKEMVEFREFIESMMTGLIEIEILRLTVNDIINILDSGFISNEDFAFHYALSKSEAGGVVYLEKNPTTKKINIKKEFILTNADAVKIGIILGNLDKISSIEEAKCIISDIDSIIYKCFHYEKAKRQLELYNLALVHGRKANIRINSMLELYSKLTVLK